MPSCHVPQLPEYSTVATLGWWLMVPAFSEKEQLMIDLHEYSSYHLDEVVRFRRTRGEDFGGLSNMAAGFPLFVAQLSIRTSEALYQACRYPGEPEIQRLIIEQLSPMAAKMKAKRFITHTRPDWEEAQFAIMRWSLRVKLTQNWEKFSELLLETEGSQIVEESRKDKIWSARPTASGRRLFGRNILGKLLVELRDEVARCDRHQFTSVEPLNIRNFRLDGRQIGVVTPPDTGLHATSDGRQEQMELLV